MTDEDIATRLATLSDEWVANATRANSLIADEQRIKRQLHGVQVEMCDIIESQHAIRAEVFRLSPDSVSAVCPNPAQDAIDAAQAQVRSTDGQ